MAQPREARPEALQRRPTRPAPGWTRCFGARTIPSRIAARWLEWRLRRHALAEELWVRVVAELPLCDGLPPEDVQRLRLLATRFVAEKGCFGAQGFVVSDYARVVIAAQACRLALNLGYGALRACRTVVLYPGGFVAERETEDEHGIVHRGYEELDGEAMHGGAVALAWEEARPWRGGEADGWAGNVVLHEFAHKLDELNGDCNGMPPLRQGMSARRWTAAFAPAFDALGDTVQAGEPAPLDDYAAQSPAEFFAVAVEAFFTAPHALVDAWPLVYSQLAELFAENPLANNEAAR